VIASLPLVFHSSLPEHSLPPLCRQPGIPKCYLRLFIQSAIIATTQRQLRLVPGSTDMATATNTHPAPATLLIDSLGQQRRIVITEFPFSIGRSDECDAAIVGLMEDAEFRLIQRQFAVGSKLCVLTDGISETENHAGQEFGITAVETCLSPIQSCTCSISWQFSPATLNPRMTELLLCWNEPVRSPTFRYRLVCPHQQTRKSAFHFRHLHAF
jgi:hypothetical protein